LDLNRKKTDSAIPSYQLDLYEPLPTKKGPQEHDDDVSLSTISLDTLSGSASVVDNMPSSKHSSRTPSSVYLDKTARVPINMNDAGFDKNK